METDVRKENGKYHNFKPELPLRKPGTSESQNPELLEGGNEDERTPIKNSQKDNYVTDQSAKSSQESWHKAENVNYDSIPHNELPTMRKWLRILTPMHWQMKKLHQPDGFYFP